MTKTGTIEQWRELGNLCKEINNKLVDAIVLADSIMSRQERNQDYRSSEISRKFNNLRSDWEEIFWRQMKTKGKEAFDPNNDTFYGKIDHYKKEVKNNES